MVEEKRTAQVHLRLTEREAALMRNRAQAAGLGLSAYVRSRALSGDEPAPAADARELRPVYAELRRCGSNVNQIARALNTYGAERVDAEAVSDAARALESAADAVAGALARSR